MSTDVHADVKKSLLKLADQAAKEFSSGNVAGATGIVGVLLIVTCGFTIFFGSINDTNPVAQQLALLFGSSGLSFVGLAGYLHHQDVQIRHESLKSMVDGYFMVTGKLVEKVNDKSVNVDDINGYSQKYLDSAYGLLQGEAPESDNG